MSRRTKIIIAIVIILLIILAILLFWFRFRGEVEPEPVVVVEEEVPVAEVETTTPPIAVIPEEMQRDETEVSVETLAKTFAERYGSYSNESEFANLRDLEPLMTARFQAEIEAMIAATELSDVYHGITTRVISINITAVDEDAGIATVSVLTQREEAMGSPLNAEVRYETLMLDLLKEAGSWKVDDATWE